MQIFDPKISMSFRMKENFYLLHNFCYVSTDLHINVYQRILQQARIVLNVPYPKQKHFWNFFHCKMQFMPENGLSGLRPRMLENLLNTFVFKWATSASFCLFSLFLNNTFLKKRFIGIQTRIVGTEWKNAVTAQSNSFVSLKP